MGLFPRTLAFPLSSRAGRQAGRTLAKLREFKSTRSFLHVHNASHGGVIMNETFAH